MGMEKEITEILNEYNACDLAGNLMERIELLTPPSNQDRESITRILEDVAGDVPFSTALWIAFWMGCAWQNLRD